MRFKKIELSKPYQTQSRVACDRCGGRVESRGWSMDAVTIEAKLGDLFPECDTRASEHVDCCVACWPLVRKALEGIGFKFRDGRVDDDYDDMPWDPDVTAAERGEKA